MFQLDATTSDIAPVKNTHISVLTCSPGGGAWPYEALPVLMRKRKLKRFSTRQDLLS